MDWNELNCMRGGLRRCGDGGGYGVVLSKIESIQYENLKAFLPIATCDVNDVTGIK
jgi:hypothetical protein